MNNHRNKAANFELKLKINAFACNQDKVSAMKGAIPNKAHVQYVPEIK
jgi:hypothetical protein